MTNRFLVLKREDPEKFMKMEHNIRRLISEGLSADDFWDLWVQCLRCKRVCLAHHYAYYHDCILDCVSAETAKYARIARAFAEARRDGEQIGVAVNEGTSSVGDSDLDLIPERAPTEDPELPDILDL